VGVEIRRARPEDAPEACVVMRRSIAELCAADHRNNEAILSRWLANKTVEHFTAWLADPHNAVLVATEDGAILAVGAVRDTGEITLNYVSPDARFRGVSRAMLAALEAQACGYGRTRCTLRSTETARRFYHDAGYVDDGPPAGNFGTDTGYPMVRQLA
jgi:GNAT superfamily N-acetyltransferase